MKRGLRFIVLIRKDLKVSPFADVITKAALSTQLFKDPEFWSGRRRNQDLPHGSPVLKGSQSLLGLDGFKFEKKLKL